MSSTIELSAEHTRRLEGLARRLGEPAEVLLQHAVERYVEDELRDLEELDAGLADVEAGRVVDHDAVEDWLRTWGTKKEGRAPV
ncbi:MAG: CopG family transcriptional regulator [Myxococcales bacterium]|nr:CopG family transcriptional regulator [Myxococcales bacterium]